MFVFCSVLYFYCRTSSRVNSSRLYLHFITRSCIVRLMKKYVMPSIGVVSAAAITGVFIGISLNHSSPTAQFISKTASVQDPSPSTTNITNTVPTTPQSAPTATTGSPTPTAHTAPTTAISTPVTTTAFEQIPLDNNGNIDCKLTYSDGTTYQWHWQTYVPHYQWVISRNGVGAWESTTQVLNDCDQSVVGTAR